MNASHIVLFFFKCKIQALSRLGDLRGGYLASWPAPLVRSEVETTLTRTDIRNHLNTTENNCILKRKIYWIVFSTYTGKISKRCIKVNCIGKLQNKYIGPCYMDLEKYR